MEPDERDMRDRIEAARARMAALVSPEWIARIRLHAILLPNSRFQIDDARDRINIVSVGPVQSGTSSLG